MRIHRQTILTSLAFAALVCVSPMRASAQQGDRAFIFCGDGGVTICAEGTQQLKTALVSAGAAGVEQDAILPDLTTYRLIFVVVPMDGMNPQNVTAFVDFYNAGGYLVGVSESSGYGTGYASPSLNFLSNALGFGSMFDNTNFDSGCTKSGFPISGDALMSTVTAFDYAWSASVTGGVPLARGQAGQDLMHVRDRFVAAADANIFTDNCGLNGHAPYGNIQFFKNLWTWSRQTADDDGDGVTNGMDNCPSKANPNQLDTDSDGMGNVCESDDDGDGIADLMDNCPLVSNADQTDTNGDSEGDACDIDDDGDKVIDGMDNCPVVKNTEQADQDKNGLGDACDPDIDGDGRLNGDDPCPTDPTPDCSGGGVGIPAGNGGGGGNGGAGGEAGNPGTDGTSDDGSKTSIKCQVDTHTHSRPTGSLLLLALSTCASIMRRLRRNAT